MIILGPAIQELEDAKNNFLDLIGDKYFFTDKHIPWNRFVRSLDTIWNKIKGGRDSEAVELNNFIKLYEEVRKSDPLIKYLMHARNCAEHTIRNSVNIVESGVFMGESDMEFLLNGKSVGKQKVNFQRLDSKLVQFKSRGVDYYTPNEHLGRKFDYGEDPVAVGYAGIMFYAKLLFIADVNFANNTYSENIKSALKNDRNLFAFNQI